MQEIKTPNLIVALEKERVRRGLNHKGFSTLLRISESYWCMLRKGDRRLTPNLAVLFMQKLPEITPEVQAFILQQGKDGDEEEK